ncbi:uncharacterized protein LOC113233400 [Hyposmocoma kahamanoa]|uniref:uncharacterized protein LOC113233400 n=1 Tax=Hyposmocoma kahamanoa TaxID=1477025 RepID=UPI000E6D774D|nr:uncharacterized protein LOC113233400 [Hyposmocoma kahamanoa]
MAALIFWNISKAMESNPYINLKESLRAVQKNLQSNEYDVNTIISQQPVERHLACAYLAWQQIGHSNADSLYNLILSRTANECCTSKDLDKDFEQNKGTEKTKVSFTSKDVAAEKKESHFSRKDIPKCENNTCVGPVVKLPVDAKIVMRVDGSLIGNCCAKKASNKDSSTSSKQPKINEDLQAKIDQACCLDLACNSRLSALDQSTKELRTRAAKLAQREAERVELLERAEGAWRQLEVGYQRRLRVALEKEQDATRQIKKLICDRNCFKETTMVLVAQIKDYAIKVDVSRKSLEDVEKTFCAVGLDRLKYNDESTKVDTMLAEEQCKASQLDRDLLFKEEQARRRVLQLESELDSRRALLCEAQRAMRAELNGLRDQLKNVSKEFNDAEADIERIKKEVGTP